MRTRLEYVLVGLLLSALFCQLAASQESRISGQSGQLFFLKPTETYITKFPEVSTLRADASHKEEKTVSVSSTMFAYSPAISTFQTIHIPPQSAHIIILPSPSNVDPKMIVEIPRTFHSNMPLFRGMSPSSRDVRGAYDGQQSYWSMNDPLFHFPK